MIIIHQAIPKEELIEAVTNCEQKCLCLTVEEG